MKKVWIVICAILISGVSGYFCGKYHLKHTGKNESKVYSELMVEYQEFDDILEAADEIVEGKLQAVTVKDNYEEYIVNVNQCIKGEQFEQIRIRNYYYSYNYSYQGMEYSGVTNTDYKVGDTYVFVLQHISNVYEDQYVILADIYLDMNKGTVFALSQELDKEYNCEYIKQYEYKNNSGEGDALSIPYTKEESLAKIVCASQYIVEVEIKELYGRTDVADIYVCAVNEVLKGNVTTTEENYIIVPFFEGQIHVGERAVVLLNSDTEGAMIYTLSSKNSVRSVEEISAIRNIIGKGETE